MQSSFVRGNHNSIYFPLKDRVKAFAFDLIIGGIIMFSFFLTIGVIGNENMIELTTSKPGFLFIEMLFYVVYFAVMESSPYQATFGKLILGAKVTDENGNRIGFFRALFRNLIKQYVSALFLGIGCAIALFTKQKQTLHDIICKTLVVSS